MFWKYHLAYNKARVIANNILLGFSLTRYYTNRTSKHIFVSLFYLVVFQVNILIFKISSFSNIHFNYHDTIQYSFLWTSFYIKVKYINGIFVIWSSSDSFVCTFHFKFIEFWQTKIYFVLKELDGNPVCWIGCS